MFCHLCGYMMDAFDKTCPRCQGKGLPQPPPPVAPSQTAPLPPATTQLPQSVARPSVFQQFKQTFNAHTQALAEVEDFEAHQVIWGKGHKSGIAVDEGRALVCVLWLSKGVEWNACIIKPSEIVEIQIAEDEHIVVSENSNSRTKAGGVGLGVPVLGVGIGGIKGGARTQGKQKSEQFGELTIIDLKIQTNNLRRPFHVVNFMQHWKTNRRGFVYPKAREQADYWHALLVALMLRPEA